MSKGLIHVYTGEGKGKTTAAFGLAMRAAGHGQKVLVLQFLKSRMANSGETKSAKKCGIDVITFKDQTSPFFDSSVKVSDLKKAIKDAILISIEKIKSLKYNLVILEEFNNLFSKKYATLADVKNILKELPDGVELVFTGRNAPKALIEFADYVTEMKMIRHPFNKSIKARKGIEF